MFFLCTKMLFRYTYTKNTYFHLMLGFVYNVNILYYIWNCINNFVYYGIAVIFQLRKHYNEYCMCTDRIIFQFQSRAPI